MISLYDYTSQIKRLVPRNYAHTFTELTFTEFRQNSAERKQMIFIVLTSLKNTFKKQK